MDLNLFLDDLKRRKKWFAKPYIWVSIENGSTKYVINITFHHKNCAHVFSTRGEDIFYLGAQYVLLFMLSMILR